MRHRLSEPEFHGDLVYKLEKLVGSNNFSVQFIKIISHYKKIGYNIDVLQQTACLEANPIMVGNFAFLFNCAPVGQVWCLIVSIHDLCPLSYFAGRTYHIVGNLMSRLMPRGGGGTLNFLHT